MALPLSTLSLAGSALVWGFGALKKRKEEREAAALANAPLTPPSFADDDVKEFTREQDGSRWFQADIVDGLSKLFEARSLRPLAPSTLSADPAEVLALGSLGTFYELVPGDDALASAAHVLRECQKSGSVVVGSLSLVLLPSGADYHMIVGVGGRSLAEAANSAGEFAILTAPPAPKAAKAPEPELVIEDKPAPDVSPILNGNGKHETDQTLATLATLDAIRTAEDS